MHSGSGGAERFGDCLPLVFQAYRRLWLAGAAIPVSGIEEIPFRPVQVRVHPGRLGRRIILHDLMRSVLIAGGDQSEGSKHRFFLSLRHRLSSRSNPLETHTAKQVWPAAITSW
jgi:hypothetical protein